MGEVCLDEVCLGEVCEGEERDVAVAYAWRRIAQLAAEHGDASSIGRVVADNACATVRCAPNGRCNDWCDGYCSASCVAFYLGRFGRTRVLWRVHNYCWVECGFRSAPFICGALSARKTSSALRQAKRYPNSFARRLDVLCAARHPRLFMALYHRVYSSASRSGWTAAKLAGHAALIDALCRRSYARRSFRALLANAEGEEARTYWLQLAVTQLELGCVELRTLPPLMARLSSCLATPPVDLKGS